jgi:hypothetical protein
MDGLLLAMLLGFTYAAKQISNAIVAETKEK